MLNNYKPEVQNRYGEVKPAFSMTHNVVMSDPELSDGAKVLYNEFLSMLKFGESSVIAYVMVLAERIHKCRRATQYLLKELHERGVIIRKFRRSKVPCMNLPSEFVIVGGYAPCYKDERGNPNNFYIDGGLEKKLAEKAKTIEEKNAPLNAEVCTPTTDIYIKDDSNITINREAELPEKNFSSSENASEEVSVNTEIPDILKTTANHMLMVSGRSNLSPTEMKILRQLLETHASVKIQEEINTAAERFKSKGKSLRCLSFNYIGKILENQKPKETVPAKTVTESVNAEVPDILQTTANYMLMVSGRSNLSLTEIKIIKQLFKTHTPVRIQKEIDSAAERFKRKGKNLRCLSFNYIGKALESQKSLKPKKAKTEKIVRKNKLTAEEAKKIISETPKPEKKAVLLNVPKGISMLDYLRLKFPEEDEKTFYRDVYNREHDDIVEKKGVQEAIDVDTACSNCTGSENCSLPWGFRKGGMRPHAIIRTDRCGFKYLFVGYGGHINCKFENVKKDIVDARLLKKSGLTASQVTQTFENHEKTSTDVLIAEAEALKASRNKTSLILAGKTGTGKTHLASAIAIEAMKEKRSAIFKVVPELLDELRLAAMNRQNFFELMQKYKDVSCLVLDDLGKERTTKAGLDYLYQIIDYRYRYGRQTIITTNALAPEGLYNPWNVDVMKPIISRILEKGEWVTITDADDYRTKESEVETLSEEKTPAEVVSEAENTPVETLHEEKTSAEIEAKIMPKENSGEVTEVQATLKELFSELRKEDGEISLRSVFQPVKKTWDEISSSREYMVMSDHDKLLTQWEYYKGTPEYEKMNDYDKIAMQLDFVEKLGKADKRPQGCLITVPLHDDGLDDDEGDIKL